MSDDLDWKKVTEKSKDSANGLFKGNKAYAATTGKNYKILFDTSKSCKVNVLSKTGGAGGKPQWVLRLDKAHKGANYNHININPKISKVPDPHIKLPPGALTGGKGVAKFCKTMNKVNKVAVPLAIAVDTVSTGVSVYQDVQNGTSRNTVESLATVAGGWGGGYGGAAGGAAIGTMIFPGVGTIIGGIIGGIGGGIGGSLGASAVVNEIADSCDYDVEEVKCKSCGKRFKIKKYRGEKYCNLCPSCRD